MVYVVGVFGFIGGFMAGQMALYFMLRHKTREELLEQAHLKWTYGVFNWVMAVLGASSFVKLYGEYFY